MTATDCPFCGLDGYVVGANATCYARLDKDPVAPGHTLIVPKRHVESYFDLTPDEASAAHQMLWEVRRRINQAWQPDGYTIAVDDGRAAGRTVDHLHIHLIPRHFGDVPDPRGGIRCALPNGDPEAWLSATEVSATTPGSGHDRLKAMLALAARRAETIPDSHRTISKHKTASKENSR